MRQYACLFLLLATACGKAPEAERDAQASGPSVGAAPVAGVALDYRYAFRLPVQAIAATQEQHAARCEALGPARCRISGMTYRVTAKRTIDATLALKLAPEIARRFGREAVDAVVARGGMLAEAEIRSEDAGVVAEAAMRRQAESATEQADIARQLARPGLPAAERTQLQARLQELRDSRSADSQAVADSALKLASTPMAFAYTAGAVDPGLRDGPILGAAKDGWANIVAGAAAVLMLAITLAPWFAGALAALWLWRRFGHHLDRFGRRAEP